MLKILLKENNYQSYIFFVTFFYLKILEFKYKLENLLLFTC